MWPAVAAALAALAAFGWLRPSGGGADPPAPVHFEAVPEAADPLSALGGTSVSISPDGRTIAYLSFALEGVPTIFVRDLASLEPRVLATGSNYTSVRISADGRSVLARGGGRLYEIPLAGGPVRTLAEGLAPQSTITVARDGGVIYVDSAGQIMKLGADGGAIPVETEAGVLEGLGALVVAEDGRSAVAVDLTSAGAEVGFSLVDLGTGEQTPLGRGVPFGYRNGIVTWADAQSAIATSAVYGQRLDLAERRLVGSPVPLLQTSLAGASVDLADTGDLAYLTRGSDNRRIVRVSRDGTRTDLGASVAAELGVRTSRNGRHAVYDAGFSQGETQVYLLDAETGLETRVSFEGGIYPSITPDGRRIFYYRVVDGDYALYARNVDGSGEEQVILDTESATVDVAVIPGTNRILVREGDQARLDGGDIVAYEIGDPDSAVPVAAGPGNQLSPSVSPDGRYLAYSSDAAGGEPEIFVLSLDNPAEFWQLSDDGGSEPQWSLDGAEVYYRAGGNLVAVPVDPDAPTFRRTGPTETLFDVNGLVANQNRTAYGVAEDGFYFIASSSGSINVILNWWSEVERLVGGR